MEVNSLKGLMEIVERTENVSVRISALGVTYHDAGIPDVPLPLSLNATEEWLELATECCRKPLLARSKQLLGAKGIATATIPAAVLESPDSIADLLERANRLHQGLHSGIFQSLASALTKGIEDGESVVATFTAASDELNTVADSEEWVVALAAAKIVETPSNATPVVAMAQRVIENRNAAAQRGVQVLPFVSLEEALASLSNLNAVYQEYERLLASEGLPDERVALTGLLIQEAANKLLLAMANVKSEKTRLAREAQTIESQLALLGDESPNTASTIAELRHLVPRLQQSLEERKRVFRTSLGATAFQVVESLVEGKLPTAEDVTNEDLGNAIRKAIECGYRFQLEAPHENR
jgi:hypothetical protein